MGNMKARILIIKLIQYSVLGLIWSYSNIGYPLEFLSWVAFVPFLFFIRKEKTGQGIIFSLVFGLSFYLAHLAWMPAAFSAFFSNGGNRIIITAAGLLVTLVFSLYHGFMYALIFILLRFFETRFNKNFFYPLIPAIVTVLDFFYPKFWFDRIGYAAHHVRSLIQTADLGGVPYLTFLIIACNTSILLLVESKLKKDHLLYPVTFSSIFLLLLGSSFLYGTFRIKEIDVIAGTSPKAVIGVVQGNFSGIDKRDDRMLDIMVRTYNSLSLKLSRQSPDLIVWPESADPHYYDIARKDYSQIKKFPSPLIFGTHLYEGTDENGNIAKAYNSLVLLSKDGSKIDHYHKRKLLPFIEGFPIKRLTFVMHWYGFDNFSAGTGYKILRMNNLNIAPDICYEDIIPSYIRKSIYVNGVSANILVNATNNSWFGRSREPYIHYAISKFRAIENRRTYASATCTGYSSIFDPSGRELYKSGLFTRESVAMKVPLVTIKTLYEQGGWLFSYLLALFLAAIATISFIKPGLGIQGRVGNEKNN